MNSRPPTNSPAARVRRAKIVCTLGPATSSAQMIDRLLRAGMDVARLNFSHGTHAQHATAVRLIRAASARYQKPTAILADLSGPKIRTGRLERGEAIQLRTGQNFVISTAERAGNREGISVNYKALPSDVKRGDRILLADGLIELRVE